MCEHIDCYCNPEIQQKRETLINKIREWWLKVLPCRAPQTFGALRTAEGLSTDSSSGDVKQ